MNTAVYQGARAKGLTDRQARFLAIYVESEGIREAAAALGIAEQTGKNLSTRMRHRLRKAHIAAVVAHVLTD